MTYFSILNKRGYKPLMTSRKVSVYVKDHKRNVGTIVIFKDTHCKGQQMTYEIRQLVKDNGENLANFDKDYLIKEANYILSEFNRLRERNRT